jgi:hypothetical protein
MPYMVTTQSPFFALGTGSCALFPGVIVRDVPPGSGWSCLAKTVLFRFRSASLQGVEEIA